MKCNYCDKQFEDTPNGIAVKTFHEILHEKEIVN